MLFLNVESYHTHALWYVDALWDIRMNLLNAVVAATAAAFLHAAIEKMTHGCRSVAVLTAGTQSTSAFMRYLLMSYHLVVIRNVLSFAFYVHKITVSTVYWTQSNFRNEFGEFVLLVQFVGERGIWMNLSMWDRLCFDVYLAERFNATHDFNACFNSLLSLIVKPTSILAVTGFLCMRVRLFACSCIYGCVWRLSSCQRTPNLEVCHLGAWTMDELMAKSIPSWVLIWMSMCRMVPCLVERYTAL